MHFSCWNKFADNVQIPEITNKIENCYFCNKNEECFDVKILYTGIASTGLFFHSQCFEIVSGLKI